VATKETVFKNEKGEIWHYYRNDYMFYVADKKIGQMVKKWQNASYFATYWYPDGRICHQYIIPYKLKRRAISALKGTYPKNNNSDSKHTSHFVHTNSKISHSKGKTKTGVCSGSV